MREKLVCVASVVFWVAVAGGGIYGCSRVADDSPPPKPPVEPHWLVTVDMFDRHEFPITADIALGEHGGVMVTVDGKLVGVFAGNVSALRIEKPGPQ